LTDDDWSSGRTLGDLMDWTPDLCSRLSLERVKVYEDGIPTMDKLSTLSSKLPPSPPPHPALGNPKPYNQHRKQQIYQTIYTTVSTIVKPQVEKILSMQNWNEKQDAIDELFDTILHRIKYDHLSEEDGYIARKSKSTSPDEQDVDDYIPVVLGSQPDFHKLVERALEEYLRNVVKDEKKLFENSTPSAATATSTATTSTSSPIFMDLLHGKNPSKSITNGVPDILYPLQPHPKDGPGKMIEEWELAANEDTKRIMIRQCIADIAQSLSSDKSRVYVKGRRGAGKSSALAAIVASARTSGHIVFYLPDGARLSKLGFYNEFNAHCSTSVDDIDGHIYDLPLLSQEVCSVLLNSHEKDMNDIMVPNQYLDEFFSSDLLQKLYTNLNMDQSDGGIPINSILKVGNENLTFASACYGAAIQTLMNQSKTPFTIVLDDFNCYFDQGHYYN
jgi:small subunit ribosomal protein S29